MCGSDPEEIVCVWLGSERNSVCVARIRKEQLACSDPDLKRNTFTVAILDLNLEGIFAISDRSFSHCNSDLQSDGSMRTKLYILYVLHCTL